MSWFRPSPAEVADAAPAPHLQALKRQARNRLIGMVVLVLLGIALFAWVLDGEPRQNDRDIVYQIPARGESLSVRIPAQGRQQPESGPSPTTPQSSKAAAHKPAKPALAIPAPSEADSPAQMRARRRAALAEGEEFIDDAPLAAGNDEPANAAAQVAAAQALADKAAADKLAREKAQKAQQQAKQEAQAQAEKEKAEKAQTKAEEAARARALLEGKAEPKTESKTADAEKKSERSVVQFGSFSDAGKAAETRRKVEAAGLKTYAQVIDTPRGKLIRVRVGPFNDPDEAAAAAKKIKALGLPAAVLTL